LRVSGTVTAFIVIERRMTFEQYV